MSYNKKYYQTWYKKHQKERILAVRAYREKNSIWWNKYRQKYYLKNKKLIAIRKRRYGMTAQGIYMVMKKLIIPLGKKGYILEIVGGNK